MAETNVAEASPASQAWHFAVKIRKHLLKQLDKIETRSSSGVDIGQFEAVDSILQKFRLGCVQTIFLDLEYATEQNSEGVLWQLHTSINTVYRQVLGRLRPPQAVEKRKLEKMQNDFLRTAQGFYKGYIQRLTARYDVQELKRIAQGIELEPLASEDFISPVPEELSHLILESCHSTLIHLGDLARYRILARHKKSGFENALVYYSLARDLQPDSGYALHQMGHVDLDQGNHLDVVYHFYGAWTAAEPHPLAKANLEHAFKNLQLSSSGPRNSPSPQDAFVMWFVRLHALFYEGQPSPKHEELEGEVLHRLEMAAKTATSAATLLKMVIVNISAYHVARKTYADNQSESAKLFCWYTLRFNVRFMVTISGVLDAFLKEAATSGREALGEDEAEEPNLAVESLLPLLRVYSSWLVARRVELFGASATFSTVVPVMVQRLARVFTLLCAETYKQENLTSCHYLLAEDLEIRGLQPFSKEEVPHACRFYCGEDGKPKPVVHLPQHRLEPSREGMARILDVLRCAYFMAEDPAVPLACRVGDEGLMFEYQPDQPIQQQRGQSSQDCAPTAPAAAIAGTVPVDKAPEDSFRAIRTSISDQMLADPYEKLEQDVVTGDGPGGAVFKTSTTPDGMASEANDDAENTVINMLADFLKPPTPQPHHNPPSSFTSSYGMQTATAQDASTPFQPEPSPTGSVHSLRLEPLPWDWVFTPTPRKDQQSAAAAGKEAFSNPRSRIHSSRTSISTAAAPEDPFTTSSHSRSTSAKNQDAGRLMNLDGVASEGSPQSHLLSLFTSENASPVPRQSPFSHWAQGQNSPQQQHGAATGSPWEPVASRAPWEPVSVRSSRPLQNVPAPSEGSVFSHMSSLYHGTPNNITNDASYNASYEVSTPGPHGSDPEQATSDQRPPMRPMTMDQVSSNYDAAVLQSAFQEK